MGSEMCIRDRNYIYNHPNSIFAATFLGTPQINLIDGKMEYGVFENEYFKVLLPQYSDMANEAVVLGVRAENLHICDEKTEDFKIKVDYTEYLGAKSIIHGLLGTAEITVITKEDIGLRDTLSIRIDRSKVNLFDKTTTKGIGSDTDEMAEA